MFCNKCGQEMPEIGTFCPFCGAPKEEMVLNEEIASEEVVSEEVVSEEVVSGEAVSEEQLPYDEELPQQEPPKKKKVWPIIALIAGGVIALAAIVFAVLYFTGVIQFKENNIYYKESYTVENEQVEKKADTVIATMGSEELTNGQLQLYYMNYIYTFYSQYYYGYMGDVGVDFTQPLDEQPCPLGTEGQTWQQYFMENALLDWQSYAILNILVERDGYTPTEEMQQMLDQMPANLESMAKESGFEDVKAYLAEQLAPGVSAEAYMEFNRRYYVGSEYLDHCYQELFPTAEQIDAYYQENQQTFAQRGIEPGMGLQSAVRHILIMPEGGTADELGNTTYTEEEMAAAYAEAERILEEWKSGDATEESFAALANTYSKDGGSNTTGGLYTDINADASFVQEFRDWAVDENRQVGDTGIVQTQFGYHIMYFVSGEDYFSSLVGQQLVADRIQEKLVAVRDEFPMEVNYKKIVLFAPEL